MRIPKIKTEITKFINTRKYINEQKFLNKHVSIDMNIEADAYNQLSSARKTLANYAKAKNVKISIADGKKVYNNGDNLILTVSNLNKKATNMNSPEVKMISKDINKTYHYSKPDHFVVEIPEDGTQIVRLTSHEHEDNFLRNIYRNISDMANKINPSKNNKK